MSSTSASSRATILQGVSPSVGRFVLVFSGFASVLAFLASCLVALSGFGLFWASVLLVSFSCPPPPPLLFLPACACVLHLASPLAPRLLGKPWRLRPHWTRLPLALGLDRASPVSCWELSAARSEPKARGGNRVHCDPFYDYNTILVPRWWRKTTLNETRPFHQSWVLLSLVFVLFAA